MMHKSLGHRAWRVYREAGISGLVRKTVEKLLFEQPRSPESVYWRITPAYYRYIWEFHTDAYEAPLDPLKIEYVDPANIVRRTTRDYPPWEHRARFLGKVQGGDWDRPVADYPRSQQVQGSSKYQAFKKRFIDGRNWTELELVQDYIDRTQNGETVWHGCTSRSEVLERCHFIDGLYAEMKEEGYKSQAALRSENVNEEDGFLSRILNEVCVDIGRTGELLHVCGTHRLVLAKILNLDRIPVTFLVRHPEWMAYRDRAYNQGPPYPPHSDIREFERDTKTSELRRRRGAPVPL